MLVDLAGPRHRRHVEEDHVVGGQDPAAHPGAQTERHEGDAVGTAEAHEILDLLRAPGPDDAAGLTHRVAPPLAERAGRPVVAAGEHLGVGGDDVGAEQVSRVSMVESSMVVVQSWVDGEAAGRMAA